MLARRHRKQVLITGMETHICVFQTVRDLADGAGSRASSRTPCCPVRRRTGAWAWSCAARRAPASLTVESALFDMLGRAGTPEFKKVSAAVR